MKKSLVCFLAVAMLTAVGCGAKEETTDVTSSSTDVQTLSTPEVKDGVMRPGEDAIEVYFEWEPVEGADGYEVEAQNKFYSDETFGEPEIVEVTDNFYIETSQDYFDFMIKVRAFMGDGENRVYSDWSNEAVGFSYEDSELPEGSGATEFTSYDELISTIQDGLENGFSEDQQMSLDISTCFYMNNSDFEILGYMIKDLDGDGVDELLLGENSADGLGPDEGWDSIIYDLYTMQDGKVVHVFDGWERNRYYMCTDGTIANEGSSGAAYSSWAYYNYKDGKLNIIESVFTDEDDNLIGHCYHSDKEPYEDESNEVTEDEAMDIVESYTYKKLEFTAF